MKTLNTHFKLILSLILVLGALFTSCDKNDHDNGTNDPITINETELDLGSTIQRDFIGRIVDEADQPIEDVTVTIGTKNTTTDANGVFIINSANAKEKQVYIIAEKGGYLKGLRTIIPTSGSNTIRIKLIAENDIATVASGVASEVNLVNGTTVRFDGSFMDEDGNDYVGDVTVMLYHLDPSNPSIDDIMPGDLQAQNINGDERVLESYGMIHVALRGASGELLNIANGHVAEIEIPVDPAQSGVAPSVIPLWHFDEVKGYWVEDGEASLVGGKYIGEVSHFSWWNCDAQFPTVTLCLNVVDAANTPLHNVKVELWRMGAIYPRVGYSNVDGEICGLIPSNEQLTLIVLDPCETNIYSTTIGPFTVNTSLGNIVIPTVSAASTVVTGNLVDCGTTSVTNGYVSFVYGNEYASVQVSNGDFSFGVLNCPSLTTFSLEGTDYDTFQTTTVLPFNFSSPAVGNIVACTAVAEYVSIQIDTNPVEYYLNNITAGQNGGAPNTFSISAINSNDNPLHAIGGTTVLGTYSFTTTPSFRIESEVLNMSNNIPNTIQFTLTNYGAIGDYIDMTISGNFTDNDGIVKSISGAVHVIRDN